MKLTIGQVSKIFSISTDTLRYYDKIGILKPDINKNNGYRFYELRHIEKLGLIIGIKYLGIPLSDIKETIEKGDISEYKNILNLQSEIIDRKIKELEDLKKVVKESKKAIDKVIEFNNEYDFSKLTIKKEETTFYGFKLKEILEAKSFSVYIKNAEYEELEIDDMSFIYISDVVGKEYDIEEEEFIYMKKCTITKSLIENFIKNDKCVYKEKHISGKIVSVDFYGTEKEMNEYIISLNNYFNNAEHSTVYSKYNFYLPKKESEALYFININLVI